MEVDDQKVFCLRFPFNVLGEGKASDVVYCPECGGLMRYNSITKRYVCKSCGLSLTHQELIELRDRLRPTFETSEERKRRERREYLKWWLKSKEEKKKL